MELANICGAKLKRSTLLATFFVAVMRAIGRENVNLTVILAVGLFATHAAIAADSRLITIPEPTPILAPLDEPSQKKSDLQQPKPDERGTEQIPLVVKIVPAEASPEQKQQDDEKAELDQQTVRNLIISTNKLLFIGTAILAIATGGLALVAFFQMRNARESIAASVKLADAAVAHAGHAEQVRVSEKSAERQLRAYVSAIPNFIAFHPNNNSFSIRYVITNHGQTPAYQMAGQVTIEVLSYPLPPDWQFPTPPEMQSRLSRSILFPGQRSPAITKMRQSIGASEIIQVTAGTERRIFVYGVIRYLDVFDRPQHTRFCYSVSDGELLSSIVAGVSLEGSDEMIFEAADRYNEAT